MGICNASKETSEISDTCSTDAKYFAYEDVEGGISITGYSIEGGLDVVISSMINSKKVVAIADYEFTTRGVTAAGISTKKIEYNIQPLYNKKNNYEVVPNKRITGVVIPNTVTSIGRRAFSNNKLTNSTIIFPTTPLTIGCYAFDSNLEEIIYPSNVTYVCVE